MRLTTNVTIHFYRISISSSGSVVDRRRRKKKKIVDYWIVTLVRRCRDVRVTHET